jgi:hypothetical protein
MDIQISSRPLLHSLPCRPERSCSLCCLEMTRISFTVAVHYVSSRIQNHLLSRMCLSRRGIVKSGEGRYLKSYSNPREIPLTEIESSAVRTIKRATIKRRKEPPPMPRKDKRNKHHNSMFLSVSFFSVFSASLRETVFVFWHAPKS